MKVFFNALKLHYLLFWAHQIIKFLLLLHLCFDLCCSVLNFKCNLKFKNFFLNVWSAHNFVWKPFVSIQIMLQNLITVIIHKFIFTKWRHSKFYHQISLYSWTWLTNLIWSCLYLKSILKPVSNLTLWKIDLLSEWNFVKLTQWWQNLYYCCHWRYSNTFKK